MIGFSRTLAQELAPHVTVNCVAPGIIATRISEAMIKMRGDEWLREIPVARFGTVEDVAHAVRFLVSERAGYINGVVLQVNGGMFMD
jgi:3-oxoacyl-[acyl-carrier protein] reductase